ncbi:MAG: DUF6101 family protein, partial [Allorhizobium sp.]
MTNTVMKPAWAGATLRLDPSRFPQQVTYAPRSSMVIVTSRCQDLHGCPVARRACRA